MGTGLIDWRLGSKWLGGLLRDKHVADLMMSGLLAVEYLFKNKNVAAS